MDLFKIQDQFPVFYGACRTIGTIEHVNVNIYIFKRVYTHVGVKSMLFIKQSVANKTVRLSPFMPACTNTFPFAHTHVLYSHLHPLPPFMPTCTLLASLPHSCLLMPLSRHLFIAHFMSIPWSTCTLSSIPWSKQICLQRSRQILFLWDELNKGQQS